ncbi:MAG TPA: hypothetical protein VKG02_21460, partial [Blastocatellia bacterium]|nr:hypothetical protein [Blastocatellia bacterium]
QNFSTSEALNVICLFPWERFRTLRRRPEIMKIAPGCAPLPACFASIKERWEKPGTLEAMRTQGFSTAAFMSRCDDLNE